MVPRALAALDEAFVTHKRWLAQDEAAFMEDVAPRVRGIALGLGARAKVGRDLIERLPKLEIIANFGVGYDGIDTGAAADHGVIVTNAPGVLTEEVADTALGLLIMTVRELPAAERYLREGRWAKEGSYRLTASLRNRTVGIAGLGRIGLAIARRLDAMQVPVVYHNRSPRTDVPYRYYADIKSMAADVDTLVMVLPGGEATKNAANAEVLKALGPDGILVNVGRGNAVDQTALIAALKDGTILAAGLDVFANEPNVPEELIALPNTVLLPHVASASVTTRDAMGQLVVDNLTSWFREGRPITPVPETPWPRPA